MGWLKEAIEQLATRPICGYRCDGVPSVEPTALTAQALISAGRPNSAVSALDWLLGVQSANGSLGIDRDNPQPCWTTGWAVLAWNMAAKKLPNPDGRWSAAANRAEAWMLTVAGRHLENNDETKGVLGHDTTLEGWPWVIGTHSWVEPTAINVLAMRSAGHSDHTRCREAVKLLLDRQLPGGGWNYGNTVVFGHALRPHVQATGLVLAALAAEKAIRPKVQASLGFLSHALSERTTAASLGFALMGLAAYDLWPKQADQWLSAASRRILADNGSPYHLALLVLAANSRHGDDR
jgi:hypothetical protein